MNTLTLVSAGCFALLLFACSALLYQQVRRRDRIAARLNAVRDGLQSGKTEQNTASWPARLIAAFGAVVIRSGVLPGKTLGELEHTLTTAGFRNGNNIALFVGCKILLLALLPVMGWELASWRHYGGLGHLLITSISAVIGLLGPDQIVKLLRRQHLSAVERGLPDALDMMVICAEAGLALEPAITRVGREIEPAHPAVSMELMQTASELRIVSDHRFALHQMGIRTGLVGLRRLATTLAQTIQYGTPLTDALRVLSAEIRGEMLTRFEARAARLPVLLTIPMIVFILPCVFLVVGGPAIIQVIHVFKG